MPVLFPKLPKIRFSIPPESSGDVRNLIDRLNSELGKWYAELSKPVTLPAATTTVAAPTEPPFPTTVPAPGGGGGASPNNASYVTALPEPGLTQNRVLAAGAGITLTDNGPTSTLVVAGTVMGTLRLITLASGTSPYSAVLSTAQWTEYRVSCAAGSDFTFNLPAATGSGAVAIIKKMDANARNVIITANGGDLIDGLGTLSSGTTQYAAAAIVDAAAGVWDVFILKP